MSSFLQFCGAQSLHPQHAKVWGFKRNWRSALHLKLWAACLKYLLLLGFIFYEKVTYMLLLLLWISGDTVLPFSSLLSIQTFFSSQSQDKFSFILSLALSTLIFMWRNLFIWDIQWVSVTSLQWVSFTAMSFKEEIHCNSPQWVSRKKFVPTSVRLAIWSQKERIRMGILKTIREIIRYV